MRKYFVDICLEVEAEDSEEAWMKVESITFSNKFKELLKEQNVDDEEVVVSKPSEVI